MRTQRGEEDRRRLAERLVGQRIAEVQFLFADGDAMALVTDEGTVVSIAASLAQHREGRDGT